MQSVFEVQWENGCLYVAHSGDVCSDSENGVGISGLFASKQGLHHGQEVTMKIVDNVGTCVKALVEPLSVDDWEILELHAEEIENGLLNQVRVVWPGMVCPVWVQKSTCIFVKIGELEPASKCCLLAERTEVHITPKDRKSHKPLPVQSSSQSGGILPIQNPSAPTTKQKVKKSVEFSKEVEKWPPDTEQNNKSRETQRQPSTEQSGLLSGVWSYFSTWWEGSTGDHRRNDLEQSEEVAEDHQYHEYLTCEWCAALRVQPVGTFRENYQQRHEDSDSDVNVPQVNPVNLAQQPTNVFLSLSTFINCLAMSGNYSDGDGSGLALPRSFLAEVSYMMSPNEKAERLKKKLDRRGYKSRVSRDASQLDEMDTEGEEEVTERRVVVRVIVLDRQGRYVVKATSGAVVGFASLADESGIHGDHVMLNEELRRQMGMEVTGRVLLRSLSADRMCTEPSTLTFYPLFSMPPGFDEDLLKIALKSWVSHHTGARTHLIVSMATLLAVPLKQDLDGEFLVSFQDPINGKVVDPTQPIFISLDRAMLEKVCVKIEKQLTEETRPKYINRLPYYDVKQIDAQVKGITLEEMGGVSDISRNSLVHILQCLCLSPLSRGFFDLSPGFATGGVLVTGPKGVGKSSLVRALCNKVSGKPWYAYTSLVDCKQMRGKRVDNIKKILDKCFSDAAWRQPSVIVLDDLDLICGAPAGPEQEMTGDAIYFTRVAQVLCDIFKAEKQESSRICVLATCRSRSSLHKSFASSKGTHYFQHVVELQPPDKTDRHDILASVLRGKDCIDPACIQDLDLPQLAARTEGFVARDLDTVVRRAVHAHRVVHTENSSELTLTTADFDAALDGFTPSSLKNVSLHKPSELGWDDIGGLQEVKHTLVETLQWPAKYPELFASCPLRLRSGLLLYGAPGTGKTLLASAVAKECGLNFISIKGPELLSKYIGASEQAVRDTFLRAQSAKPCILFFDEFDSLAPRRGHDSTGVTDRVVNQLLTQLDGVEGLEGVYVLAATSRPDLIDPALLRPGRLDKALHCTLPTQEERHEILQALTRHMELHKDVDLASISKSCEYFTGADFKALLYNAQLEAIHEHHGSLLFATGLSFSEDQSQKLVQEENCDQSGMSNTRQKVSEGSILSNGSWETLSMPHNDLSDPSLLGDNSNVLTTASLPGSDKQEAVSSARALVVEARMSKNSSVRVLDETNVSNCEKLRLGYIPSLEEGAVDLSQEVEERLRKQVLPLIENTAILDVAKQQERSTSAVLEQRHLVSALENMGPSVSEAERRRYQFIYQNFVSSKGGNFNEGIQSAGKRATLA